MKPLFLLLAGLILSLSLHSQNKDNCISGVYVTQDDFAHNRLSHQINTGEKGNKLEFAIPADMTLAVKLITPDTTLKFDPGTIYGYNECGKVFRYFKGGKELDAQEDYYEVKEVKPLIIYTSAFVSGNETFYSRSISDPIHRLTMDNLQSDFKNDAAFLEAAKKLNREPGDGLATKDKSGSYRINQVYGETVKGH
jgi:hypothetical protein